MTGEYPPLPMCECCDDPLPVSASVLLCRSCISAVTVTKEGGNIICSKHSRTVRPEKVAK